MRIKMLLQEKYIPKSSARVHLFIGNRCSGKSTAISALLYSIRNDVSKCFANGRQHKTEPYIGIIPDTLYIWTPEPDLLPLQQWCERNCINFKSTPQGIEDARPIIILDDAFFSQSQFDILCEIIKNPNVIVVIAFSCEFHSLLHNVSTYVDVLYLFNTSWYIISKTFETYFGKHFQKYMYDCFFSLTNHEKDRFKCAVCGKSKRDEEYVRFALIQDIKKSESAQIIQKWFRGWRFRKEVLWNPHTDVGAKCFKMKQKDNVVDDTCLHLIKSTDIFSFMHLM